MLRKSHFVNVRNLKVKASVADYRTRQYVPHVQRIAGRKLQVTKFDNILNQFYHITQVQQTCRMTAASTLYITKLK